MSAPWLSSVRLLSARALYTFAGPRMPGHTQLAGLSWPARTKPALVIFVSHRWRSHTHPDPDGRTLRALQGLLDAMQTLARGLDPAHPAPVPDLRAAAMLQASVLLYRLLEHGMLDGDAALDQVALFFDFTCLPQGLTADSRRALRNGLASFPTMIPDPRVALLALRHPDDGYDRRAWCVAESVLALTYDEQRSWAMTFPLRMDLVPRASAIDFQPLRDAIEEWTRRTCGRARITADDYRNWIEVIQRCVDWHGHARDEAAAQLHHSSEIADRSMRLWVTATLRVAEAADDVVELEPLLRLALHQEGMLCTEPEDELPTALLILAGLRWEALNRGTTATQPPGPATPDFWRKCLQRHLQGRPLRARVQQRLGRRPGELHPPRLALLPDGHHTGGAG